MIDVKSVQKALADLPSHEWKAGKTPFTGLSQEERLSRLGAIPIPHASGSTPIQTAKAAPSIDYKKLGYVPDIIDQGGCGSCVANAVMDHLQTVFRQRMGVPNYDIHPDRQIVWDCGAVKGGFGCKMGWYASQALDYLKNFGTFPEDLDQYTATDGVCVPYGPYELAHLIKIGAWNTVAGGDAIKAALQTSTMLSDFSIFSSFFSYVSGVYRPLPGETPVGYHEVELNAWDEDRKCWGARNSWGYLWGDQGSFYIAEGECGFAQVGYQIDPKTLEAPAWNINREIKPHVLPDLAVLTSPLPAQKDFDATTPFTWEQPLTGSLYYLYVGSQPGLKDLYDGGETSGLQALAPNLPVGNPIYATIWTKTEKGWHSPPPTQFIVTKSLPPEFPTFINPTQFGLNPDVPIQWSRVPGASAYYLYVGTQEGQKDVVDFGETLTNAYFHPPLPRGVPLHFRIFSKIIESDHTRWPHSDVVITIPAGA